MCGLMSVIGLDWRWRYSSSPKPSHVFLLMSWMLLLFRWRIFRESPCHMFLFKWEIWFPLRKSVCKPGMFLNAAGTTSEILHENKYNSVSEVNPSNISALRTLNSVENNCNVDNFERSKNDPNSIVVIGFIDISSDVTNWRPAYILLCTAVRLFPWRWRWVREGRVEKAPLDIWLMKLSSRYRTVKTLRPSHISDWIVAIWFIARSRYSRFGRVEKAPGKISSILFESRSSDLKEVKPSHISEWSVVSLFLSRLKSSQWFNPEKSPE